MLFTHRFVQHRVRAIVALLTLAAVALVLAACGGDDSSGGSAGGGSGDAETLLRQTFTGTHDIKSGKANIDLRVDISGDASIRGPVTLNISGPFESVGTDQLPKFDLALDANAQGQGFKAGLTSTSDRLFVNFGGTSYEVPASVVARLKDSYKRTQQQGSSNRTDLRALGLDPLSWLQDPTVVGTETIGGVETDHISGDVDVSALLDDVNALLARGLPGLPTGQRIPRRIPDGDRRKIEDAVKNAKVEIWSGQDDHTLRKATLALTVDIPRSSTTLDVLLSIELTDLNQPQTIEAPATTRPLSELLGQLQGLLGGAFGGGALGGSSSGGGSAGGASSKQLQDYSACVQRAGSNVQEAQKCADLLTQ